MTHSSTIFGITLFLVTCFALDAAQEQNAQPRSAVSVVVDGTSTWRIECVPQDDEAVRWAAEEMQDYIERMGRCKIPVGDLISGHPAIVIGKRSDLSTEDRSILPASQEGFDGYAVAVRSAKGAELPRIIIAGENDRGVIYGVYDLLEHFGCRWFYPGLDSHDPEVVPQTRTVSMAAGGWAVASPFKYRLCNAGSWIYEMDYDAAAKQLDWAMKNRYNGMAWGPESKTTLESQYQQLELHGLLNELSKRGMYLYGPGHCFDHLLKADDYIAQHPEWYGMRDGKRVPQTFLGAQFCWSNAEARKQFAENVVKFAGACPKISILSLAPFDGGPCCTCPECKKAGASNLLMQLMGEVVDRLHEKTPSAVVETLGGYGDVAMPPDNAKIHPNQRIIWAHWGRYHGMPYDDERYAERKHFEAWREAARGGLTVCQYYGDNFCEPWIMPPFAMAIEGDRRYLIEKKIDSVFVLMWPPGYWWNHGLNGYLAGRCFFDASLDPYREIHDYALHYFGPDAGPALAAYYEQWARQIDLAYHVRGGAQDADVAMLAEQRAKWLDPARKAVTGGAVYSYRVANVERLHRLAELMAKASRVNDELDRLRNAGRLDEARTCLGELKGLSETILELAHSYAELNQGLIDIKVFDMFVATALKGRVEAQAKTLNSGKSE
jgi:hypothetical protein